MKKNELGRNENQLFSRTVVNIDQNKILMRLTLTVFTIICLGLYTGCQKSKLVTPKTTASQEGDESMIKTAAKGNNNIQFPKSGNSCTLNNPPAPPTVVGYSAKKSWHRKVKNQTQLISAINYVNSKGGTIYIDGTFNVTTAMPKITRDNVTILSKKGNRIYDKISSGANKKKATELFRVEANGFIMKNVTILGVGHLNPSNPSSWQGKRSAVVVTKNNARFERVNIKYFTHAAIRLENGWGHKVLKSILTNQNRSDLGYGVLLRNKARNVLIKQNRFDRNTHSVATTGGRFQSYRAEGNYTSNSKKWHFDVHMGSDGYGGKKVEIINNVSKGAGSLLLVRGPFTHGIFVKKNKHNLGAGKLVELKPDATFKRNGITYKALNFYSPFGLQKAAAQAFFKLNGGQIQNNCVNQ